MAVVPYVSLSDGVEPVHDRPIRNAESLSGLAPRHSASYEGVDRLTLGFGSHSQTISTGYDKTAIRVPGAGLEPARPYGQTLLRRPRQPIAPSRPER